MNEGNLEKPEATVPEEIKPLPEASHEALNAREAIEAAVIAKNAEPDAPIEVFDETEAPGEPAKDEAAAEPKLEESLDPIERIKKETQKRINKLTAKTKSAEERVAELEAENERLRTGVKPVTKEGEKAGEPTLEQCEAALEKAIADGDSKFAAQITTYMTKLVARQEREAAEKSFNERTTKQTEAQKKELTDWVNLCRDYEPVTADGQVDMKHPLNLANQNGLLYKTALALYQDKELNGKYAGYDKMTGFRIAVNDAWRGIHEQGLYKPVQPAAKKIVERQRAVLASPDSDGAEEAPEQSSFNDNPSDAQKVLEEIKHRKSLLAQRTTPRR